MGYSENSRGHISNAGLSINLGGTKVLQPKIHCLVYGADYIHRELVEKRIAMKARDWTIEVVIEGEGPIVLYLPGLGDNGKLPPHLLEMCPHYTWLRPTYPGFPGSRGTPASSFKELGAACGDFLKQFLTGRNERRCTILGASLGARIAVELLLRVPELIEKMVLLAPAGLDQHLKSPPLLHMSGTEVFRLASLPDATEYPVSTATTDRIEQNIAAARELIPGSNLADPDLSKRLSMAKVTTPISIYWGARDAVLPRALAREWKEALPHTYVEILPQTGHVVLNSEEFSLPSTLSQ